MIAQTPPSQGSKVRLDPEEVLVQINKGLEKLEDLPLLPVTAQRAYQLAEAGDISLSKFAKLIESDASLATGVLKLANSPLYCWGRTIDSLETAVVRLGLRACRDLIVAQGMKRLTAGAQGETRQRCQRLWQHAFVVACLARQLNKEFQYDHQGEEFTGGLLHDLGRMLVALLVPDVFAVADPMDWEEPEGFLEREREVLGTDHCVLGGRYAEMSRMPATILQVIKHHHNPRKASACRGLIELVACADHLANHVHAKKRINEYDLTQNPGFHSLARSRDPEALDQFRNRLPDILKETVTAYQKSGLRS